MRRAAIALVGLLSLVCCGFAIGLSVAEPRAELDAKAVAAVPLDTDSRSRVRWALDALEGEEFARLRSALADLDADNYARLRDFLAKVPGKSDLHVLNGGGMGRVRAALRHLDDHGFARVRTIVISLREREAAALRGALHQRERRPWLA